MKKHFLHTHFFLLVITAIIFITSCSNNAPQIQNARFSVVFDYENYDDLPKARLSVFVEATSNPRRFDTVIVKCDQNEYVWEATDLLLAADDSITYCGVTNLVMPVNQQIPSGEYTIVFRQSDEEEKEIKRILNYDKTLYETKAEDVPALMKKYYGTKMITIYDDSRNVLYYGPRSAELSNSRGIWNNYRDAAEFQESWVNQNGTVICNLPVEKVVPGN